MSGACRRCGSPATVSHGARTRSVPALEGGRLVRRVVPVAAVRCRDCGHVRVGSAPAAELAQVRGAVVDAAVRNGIAGAARDLGCGPDAVRVLLAEWTALREADLADEWPADHAVAVCAVAGRDRFMLGDVDRGLLVDVVDGTEGYARWGRRGARRPERIWMGVSQVVRSMAERTHPGVPAVVPPVWARRAIDAAAEATFRSIRRRPRPGDNHREDVETFLKDDAELDEHGREGVGDLWSVPSRVLRRHRIALAAALRSGAEEFRRSSVAALAWLRVHAPASRLAGLLGRWTDAIAAGAGAVWPDRFAADLGSLAASIASRAPTLASHDLLRATVMMKARPDVRDEIGRGRNLADLLKAFAV